ncbi:uncharacterized protein LOC129758039 [Uranotaenia lowii]|uniref:uncharacterized protein LOC129758039 n=1 Tax=Uranotaenia lowii TaxID=190385 RepID=UPI00247A106B|nr:uncharacterized protein LOC129758039 [Uranotaenia lowii]
MWILSCLFQRVKWVTNSSSSFECCYCVVKEPGEEDSENSSSVSGPTGLGIGALGGGGPRYVQLANNPAAVDSSINQLPTASGTSHPASAGIERSDSIEMDPNGLLNLARLGYHVQFVEGVIDNEKPPTDAPPQPNPNVGGSGRK